MPAARITDPFLRSVAGSTRATAYHMMNKAAHSADKAFVTWLDAIENVFVRSDDHISDTWFDMIVINEGGDNHTIPSLSVTPDGRLRIVCGSHGHCNVRGDVPWSPARCLHVGAALPGS